MRRDQLARQWRVIRAIESSPNELSVAEIRKQGEIRIRTIYLNLETLQTARGPLYPKIVDRVNRWAVVETFKLKLPSFFQHPLIKIVFLLKRDT